MRVVAGLLAMMVWASCAGAASPSRLDALQWLAGEWRGVGEGEPGKSASERHVEAVLGGRFLRVDGRSVYPRQEGNPNGEIHAEMDMWSYDGARDTLVLRQFDNLGFVTTYVHDREASSDDRLVLVAEHLENVPPGWRARYTFTFNPPDEYEEMLELDADGAGWKPYVSNRYLRIDSTP
jgi:hypothetical protein